MVQVHPSRLPRLIAPLLVAALAAYVLSDGYLKWLSRPVAVPVALFLALKLQQAGAF
jgi:hypothetical protein